MLLFVIPSIVHTPRINEVEKKSFLLEILSIIIQGAKPAQVTAEHASQEYTSLSHLEFLIQMFNPYIP
jgi:predicted metal-dependent TIM-barrel fold hydrolase